MGAQIPHPATPALGTHVKGEAAELTTKLKASISEGFVRLSLPLSHHDPLSTYAIGLSQRRRDLDFYSFAR